MDTMSIQSDPAVKYQDTVISPEQLLKHWQEHRKITRKVIEAFPEDKLYHYSLGGMRPFAELAIEIIGMAEPGVRGVVTGKWHSGADTFGLKPPATKAALLSL